MRKNRKLVNFKHIKKLIFNKFIFTFFEINNRLVFCSILFFLSMILANQIIVDYQITKQIYDVSFRNEFNAVRYRWKIFVLNFLIFRRNTFEMFTKYFVRYNTMSKHWRKLIQHANYQDSTSWYALRKVFENEIYDKIMFSNKHMMLINLINVFQSILMQVMSHKNSQIFKKHYWFQNVLWNIQNAYLKISLNTKLVDMTSKTIFLNRNSKIFTKLTNEQKMNMMHASSEMIEKQKKMQDLIAACVRSCESIRETTRRQNFIHRRYMKIYN